MMIHAYHEMYLSSIQSKIGDAFDFSVNYLKIPGEKFIQLFMCSDVSKMIEKSGIINVIGKSGIEIALEITNTKEDIIMNKPYITYERSKEYWIGYAITYYQWYADRKFSEIFDSVSYEELEKLYLVLHEANIMKFVEIIDKKVREKYNDTNLQRTRKIFGFTQKRLAEESGVSLRSIQMYEQRNKDINKASAETIYRLAKALGCDMENLIEKG